MATAQSLDWRGVVTRGIVAGLIGVVLLDAFLYAALLVPQHLPPSALWLGSGPLWLGLLMHVIVYLAWAVAFSYAAQTRPSVPAHPYISGIVYGAIVMILMQIVQMAANIPLNLTLPFVVCGFVAHAIFFGLPVSLCVARAMRP